MEIAGQQWCEGLLLVSQVKAPTLLWWRGFVNSLEREIHRTWRQIRSERLREEQAGGFQVSDWRMGRGFDGHWDEEH